MTVFSGYTNLNESLKNIPNIISQTAFIFRSGSDRPFAAPPIDLKIA